MIWLILFLFASQFYLNLSIINHSTAWDESPVILIVESLISLLQKFSEHPSQKQIIGFVIEL